MNLEEAKANIGKEVVLDESTKPYKFLNGGDIPKQIIESFIGTRATIAQINSLGSVEIDFTLSDGSSDYWWFNPHHLKHAKEDTSFEDYHEKLSQNYSESFTSLESDMKSELEELKYENSIEIRLAIFNGNTSRTLEEMKAIEEWLLGEFK